jgi:hypothetical protein
LGARGAREMLIFPAQRVQQASCEAAARKWVSQG